MEEDDNNYQIPEAENEDGGSSKANRPVDKEGGGQRGAIFRNSLVRNSLSAHSVSKLSGS